MRISDWSSDVCSSDLTDAAVAAERAAVVDGDRRDDRAVHRERAAVDRGRAGVCAVARQVERSLALLDEAPGSRDAAPHGGIPRLIDRPLSVSHFDVLPFLPLLFLRISSFSYSFFPFFFFFVFSFFF